METEFIIMSVGKGGVHKRHCLNTFSTLSHALWWVYSWQADNEGEDEFDDVDLYVSEVEVEHHLQGE
jgi:hypothetical protein